MLAIRYHRQMRLSELTPSERATLAAALGCSPKYLYQVAAGTIDAKTGKPRRIGSELAIRAVRIEPRLTLGELRPDIWGEVEAERVA